MAYKITLKVSAQKELEKIQKPVRIKLISAINELAENPRPPGVKN
jgi:mRNA-degrading endonuclease RelE of RelBE toxin-antitoxin system